MCPPSVQYLISPSTQPPGPFLEGYTFKSHQTPQPVLRFRSARDFAYSCPLAGQVNLLYLLEKKITVMFRDRNQ